MPAPKILVIGNCTVDIAFRLPRFPQPGETLLASGVEQDIGGKGANQAVAAARAGAAVLFCAAIGNDGNGANLRKQLAAEGLPLGHVAEVPVGTDQSIIYVTPEGENCIVSSHAAAASLDIGAVSPTLSVGRAGDILLMQGNLSHNLTFACLERARAQGLVTVLNPAPIQYAFDDLWRFVDVAVLNEVETRQVAGCEAPLAGARRLSGEYGVGQVVVTLGAAGALLVDRDRVVQIPANPVEAVDTTGAGDVFCGVLCAGLVRGLDTKQAARCAVRAATLSVTRQGTQRAFPSRTEIDRILNEPE